MYKTIITHNDFDGVVWAAICSYVFKIDHIKFTGPSTITRSKIFISPNDIVCDLPYPLECGLWFDHHEGNLQELKYRNIDPDDLDGKFELKPSCAQVVYDYFKEIQSLPEFFKPLVEEANIIDAFNYKNIEDWRQERPGRIVDCTIKLKSESPQEKNDYLRKLVYWLRDNPVNEVIEFPEILEKNQQFNDEEKNILQRIEQSSFFLKTDTKHEIIIIDLTSHNRRPHIIKNLAFLLFPQSLAVIEIGNLFNRGIKTNDLSFSMSLSINLNNQDHNKDVGDIMRELNIGDGHAGAAAGTLYCSSKNEMLKQKDDLLNHVFKIWNEQ